MSESSCPSQLAILKALAEQKLYDVTLRSEERYKSFRLEVVGMDHLQRQWDANVSFVCLAVRVRVTFG